MSYDVWMTIDTGGPEPAAITDGYNYTSNVSPMWTRALGRSLKELDGMLGSEAAPLLLDGYQAIMDNLPEYRELNPKNGWGNAEGAAEFLFKLHSDCVRHPKAQLKMWV